ncbi:MAG: hypothetical protein JWR38_3574 [Mucilaginibacter sp.]|nr:hypothetical protein [Mucilaginibacter sp.]
MEIIKIRTSQNIDIDYEVAGLGDRILARIVDMGVFMGITYALYFVCIIFFLSVFERGGGLPAALIVIAVIYSLVFVFYDLVAEIFFNGQTIGKFAIKIRVVSISGARPTMGQFLLRWIFRLVDFGLTFGIGAVIAVAVSDKKQRIGDMVAGTTLVKTKPRTELADLFFTSPEDDYVPVFTEVSHLTDSDITLIHEVISNFKSTGNSSVVYNMALRIKDHLAISIPPGMNEFDFLQTIVKDYNHITSQAHI